MRGREPLRHRVRVSVARILVVGGPGSGKTTVARQLSDALRLPHHDLDRVAFMPPEGRPDAPFWQWTRTAYEDRQQWAAETAREEQWVCDGLYAGWTTPLVEAAEAVLWLDLASARCVARAVRRAALHRAHGGRDWNMQSVRVVSRGARDWVRRPPATDADLRLTDGANGRRTTAALLSEHEAKVVHARRPLEVRRAVRGLLAGR